MIGTPGSACSVINHFAPFCISGHRKTQASQSALMIDEYIITSVRVKAEVEIRKVERETKCVQWAVQVGHRIYRWTMIRAKFIILAIRRKFSWLSFSGGGQRDPAASHIAHCFCASQEWNPFVYNKLIKLGDVIVYGKKSQYFKMMFGDEEKCVGAPLRWWFVRERDPVLQSCVKINFCFDLNNGDGTNKTTKYIILVYRTASSVDPPWIGDQSDSP